MDYLRSRENCILHKLELTMIPTPIGRKEYVPYCYSIYKYTFSPSRENGLVSTLRQPSCILVHVYGTVPLPRPTVTYGSLRNVRTRGRGNTIKALLNILDSGKTLARNLLVPLKFCQNVISDLISRFRSGYWYFITVFWIYIHVLTSFS